MNAMPSQITNICIICSVVFFQANNKENFKYLRHWPLLPEDSPHKGAVTRKMFQFDDAIM